MKALSLTSLLSAIGVVLVSASAVSAQFGTDPCLSLTQAQCAKNDRCKWYVDTNVCGTWTCEDRTYAQCTPNTTALSGTVTYYCFYNGKTCTTCDGAFSCPVGCNQISGGGVGPGGLPGGSANCIRQCQYVGLDQCNGTTYGQYCQVAVPVSSSANVRPFCAALPMCTDQVNQLLCTAPDPTTMTVMCKWDPVLDLCSRYCGTWLSKDNCLAFRGSDPSSASSGPICQWGTDSKNPRVSTCTELPNCKQYAGNQSGCDADPCCGYDPRTATCSIMCWCLKSSDGCSGASYCKWTTQVTMYGLVGTCAVAGVANCQESISKLTCAATNASAALCSWYPDPDGGGCYVTDCADRTASQCMMPDAQNPSTQCFVLKYVQPGAIQGTMQTRCTSCVSDAQAPYCEESNPACIKDPSSSAPSGAPRCVRGCFTYYDNVTCPTPQRYWANVKHQVTVPDTGVTQTMCWDAPPNCPLLNQESACSGTDGCIWFMGQVCVNNCSMIHSSALCTGQPHCQWNQYTATPFCSLACWTVKPSMPTAGSFNLPACDAGNSQVTCQFAQGTIKNVMGLSISTMCYYLPNCKYYSAVKDLNGCNADSNCAADTSSSASTGTSFVCRNRCNTIVSQSICVACSVYGLCYGKCAWVNMTDAQGQPTNVSVCRDMTSTSAPATQTTGPQPSNTGIVPPPFSTANSGPTSNPGPTQYERTATYVDHGGMTSTEIVTTNAKPTATSSKPMPTTTTPTKPKTPTTTTTARKPTTTQAHATTTKAVKTTSAAPKTTTASSNQTKSNNAPTTITAITNANFNALTFQAQLAAQLQMSASDVVIKSINSSTIEISFINTPDSANKVATIASFSQSQLQSYNLTSVQASSAAAAAPPESPSIASGSSKFGLLAGVIVAGVVLVIAGYLVVKKYQAKYGQEGEADDAKKFTLDFDDEPFLGDCHDEESMQMLGRSV